MDDTRSDRVARLERDIRGLKRAGALSLLLVGAGFLGMALSLPDDADKDANAGTGGTETPGTCTSGGPKGTGKITLPRMGTETPGTRTSGRPAQQESGVTVYVTASGKKYHKAGCRYLAKSLIPISLEDAKKAYTPCSVCNPPR